MKSDEKLLDHNYDGIQELDNRLPPWWLNLFYITIIWGIGYFVYYHVLEIGDLSADEYNREMGVTVAEKSLFGFLTPYASPYSKTPEDETGDLPPGGSEINAAVEKEQPVEATPAINYELISDAARLKNGAAVYQMNCFACHGANGEGTIGPNLTDTYWINGDGSLNEIVKVVQIGVPVKGMISWKGVLKDDDLLDVASHIYNLKGTNPANSKDPQGEKYGE